jgi:hypothetical protein
VRVPVASTILTMADPTTFAVAEEHAAG